MCWDCRTSVRSRNCECRYGSAHGSDSPQQKATKGQRRTVRFGFPRRSEQRLAVDRSRNVSLIRKGSQVRVLDRPPGKAPLRRGFLFSSVPRRFPLARRGNTIWKRSSSSRARLVVNAPRVVGRGPIRAARRLRGPLPCCERAASAQPFRRERSGRGCSPRGRGVAYSWLGH